MNLVVAIAAANRKAVWASVALEQPCATADASICRRICGTAVNAVTNANSAGIKSAKSASIVNVFARRNLPGRVARTIARMKWETGATAASAGIDARMERFAVAGAAWRGIARNDFVSSAGTSGDGHKIVHSMKSATVVVAFQMIPTRHFRSQW